MYPCSDDTIMLSCISGLFCSLVVSCSNILPISRHFAKPYKNAILCNTLIDSWKNGPTEVHNNVERRLDRCRPQKQEPRRRRRCLCRRRWQASLFQCHHPKNFRTVNAISTLLCVFDLWINESSLKVNSTEHHENEKLIDFTLPLQNRDRIGVTSIWDWKGNMIKPVTVRDYQ